MKIHVIDAHNFAAMDVDDLLVQQVAAQQQQPSAPFAMRPISAWRGDPYTAVDGRNRS